MIDKRKAAFDNISRILAITRYDIEQHQAINDLALNIHGENYFRDVFNFVYPSCKLENANFESANSPCVDLIDKNNKLAYQITTTRTKEKIEKTLTALKTQKYQGYKIKIFFLTSKAKPSNETVEKINAMFNVSIVDCLLDYTDLIKDINDLETNRLIELHDKYLKGKENKYTDQIILDLIFRHLINKKSEFKKFYDDDFGNIDTNEKLTLNNINARTVAQINKGLDYREILENISQEDNLLTDLRYLVIESFYKGILISVLESKISRSKLKNRNLIALHDLAQQHNICFNSIIHKLHVAIEQKIDIRDFNSMNIAWIIIAYFFELCDVGVRKQ